MVTVTMMPMMSMMTVVSMVSIIMMPMMSVVSSSMNIDDNIGLSKVVIVVVEAVVIYDDSMDTIVVVFSPFILILANGSHFLFNNEIRLSISKLISSSKDPFSVDFF